MRYCVGYCGEDIPFSSLKKAPQNDNNESFMKYSSVLTPNQSNIFLISKSRGVCEKNHQRIEIIVVYSNEWKIGIKMDSF